VPTSLITDNSANAANRTGVGVILAFAIEFIRNDVGASTSFFMPDKDDFLKKLEEQEQQRRQNALNALSVFVTKFSPADNNTADTFFTSAELSQAVADHTGVRLEISEVYELMTSMNYQFDLKNGSEFNWLLKKE
jgi:hypothetical protein